MSDWGLKLKRKVFSPVRALFFFVKPWWQGERHFSGGFTFQTRKLHPFFILSIIMNRIDDQRGQFVHKSTCK